VAEGGMGGLVHLGADPLADFPDRHLARQGLEGARFVVAVDCFETESDSYADVVLPAAAYAERPGSTTNLEGRISLLGQKVTAPGVAWPDWMIAAELAFRLGGDLGFDTIEGIWDEIERIAPSHAGITRAVLADRGSRDGVIVPFTSTQAVSGRFDPMATPGI